MRRRRIGVPALVVDSAVGDHFEILGLSLRRRIRAGLVEGIGHADAFDRLLLDSIDRLRCLDARSLEDRGYDVDDMMELGAHAPGVFDTNGPRDGHTLTRAAKVRSDLLGILERRVEGPR